MLLLNKFIYVKQHSYKQRYVNNNNYRIVIYKNDIGYRDINYDGECIWYMEKNGICIQHRNFHDEKNCTIFVNLKNGDMTIRANYDEKVPYVIVEYNVKHSKHMGPSFIIDFSNKDNDDKILYKLAIDTYMYLREYFSVKRLSELS